MLIEVSTFRLPAGVSDDAFRAADSDVQIEFFSPQPGFMRRTTASSADGEWIVVTLWDTEGDADAAAELAKADPVVAEFISLLDEATLSVKQYSAPE